MARRRWGPLSSRRHLLWGGKGEQEGVCLPDDREGAETVSVCDGHPGHINQQGLQHKGFKEQGLVRTPGTQVWPEHKSKGTN